MNSTARSVAESSAIGTLLPTDSRPESSGRVLYYEFGVSAANPLTGGIPLAELIREAEGDPETARNLELARRALVSVIDSKVNPLKALRLSAGLSQAKLAERAGATQSYVARIEAGKVDPGTDMVSRLAVAVGVTPTRVFEAVAEQRRTRND